MADTTTQDTPDIQQQDDTEQPATGDLGDAGKKALDSERRSRKSAERRASEFEARIKEFEDRDKSEADKVSERLAAAEKRATEAELGLTKSQIALDKGLTPSQAKRLVGTTREELEADADELLKDLGERKKQGNHVPREGNTSQPKDEPMRDFTRKLFDSGA